MTTKPAVSSEPSGRFAYVVPLPDPPRLADAGEQYKHMAQADQTLETRLRLRPNTLVGGEGYLCFNRSDPMSTWVVPDCIIAFDIDPELFYRYNGYVISEMGKPPDFVMEVASRSTARRDLTTKRVIYANFGFGQYWRFDPTGGEYYGHPLAGERLGNGIWESVDIHEDANGLIWGYSPALGLDLLCIDGQLFFRDPATGEALLNQQQAQEALQSAQGQLTLLRDQVDTARYQADAAETERLRELLRRLQADAPEPG